MNTSTKRGLTRINRAAVPARLLRKLLGRFVEAVSGNRYSPQQLEASGLFWKREDGGFYDKFRGRLMFPIHNESGKIIAFWRPCTSTRDEPKYLNSPETPIYKKSLVFYNLHRAKDPMKSRIAPFWWKGIWM